MKVPSDPAKLSSTQASFRVRLPAPVAPLIDAPASLGSFAEPYVPHSFASRPLITPQVVLDTAQLPALAGVGAGTRRKGRVNTVTWSGHASPDDLAATQLLDAVRLNTVPAPATHVLSPSPYGQSVPRQPGAPGASTVPSRAAEPAWAPIGDLPEVSAPADSKHTYPGRRVDLGLVLLPLRVVLGALAVYAGFSKLCNPVYFDGGDRGSMVRWLGSLHPWKAAQPLLDFAMAHPVGAGLGVAFAQIVIGVLSILGLWQRLASGIAMALSAALLFTVSWRSGPVYDTPDLILLAAWSPLLIAGAPFASLDGRIALEAWRRYGADAPAALRRRVLRRGTVITTVVVGATLLAGSMLGAAVRTSGRTQPHKPPTDFGSPMWPANGPSPAPSPSPGPSHAPSPSPSATPSPAASASKSGKPTTHPSHSPSAGTTGAPGGTGGSSGRSGGGTTPNPGSSSGSGLIGGVLGSGPLLGLGMERTGTQPSSATT